MSVGSFFKKIFASPQGQSVQAFALTETQKAVVALTKTGLGAAVAADIATLSNSGLTGTQKFEQVVANTLPQIVTLLTSGGRAVTLAEVEDLGRALVQQVFNDTKSTKAGTVATLILGLLGLR
jgi:hypothetical protein